MDLLQKLDMMIDTTVASDVAVNNAKGKIDVIGGECPKGTTYDKIKKVCVPSKNESSVVGGSYVDGTTVNILGSGQTRVGFTTKRLIDDLARKEPLEFEMDNPTDTNIIGRKGLKFNKLTGAFTPSIWGEENE